jgi:hypothetical protein
MTSDGLQEERSEVSELPSEIGVHHTPDAGLFVLGMLKAVLHLPPSEVVRGLGIFVQEFDREAGIRSSSSFRRCSTFKAARVDFA